MNNNESISALRDIHEFRGFASREMATDPEYWRHEAAFGSGIMQAAAAAIVEIGAAKMMPTGAERVGGAEP